MRNRIGIAVCVVASFMMLCCKNSSDAQAVNEDALAVNEPVNEPVSRNERFVSIETIKDSLIRAGIRIGDRVSKYDFESFAQDERMRRLMSKYKCPDDFKSRHRYDVFGGLSNDDNHVPDSGYMYDTALARMMTEYFERHYGKITSSGTGSKDDKISYFPRIFNPYKNEWMSDLVTDSLDYDVRCDTIISWNKSDGDGVLFSRKDAISYRGGIRIVKLICKWQSLRCFDVWDGKESAVPERIPAIYYWDTLAINNTEEVDYTGVCLYVVVEDEHSHFLRTIIRDGKITSMEFFYNSGGPEKFYKEKDE